MMSSMSTIIKKSNLCCMHVKCMIERIHLAGHSDGAASSVDNNARPTLLRLSTHAVSPIHARVAENSVNLFSWGEGA